MATARLVLQRYATALLALASESGAVEAVRADLQALAKVIEQEEGLAERLASPRLTRAQKRELLKSALGSGRHDLVRRTVLLLVDKGRAGLVPQFAAVFEAAAREAAGQVAATVSSAAPLEPALRERLVQQLGALSGKSVTLEERVDAGLLGGLRVVIGSRMIDGSVKRRLDELRERLLRVPVVVATEPDEARRA